MYQPLATFVAPEKRRFLAVFNWVYHKTYGYFSIFAVLLVFIIGSSTFSVIRSITKRMLLLEENAAVIGAGNLYEQVPKLGNDEMGSLAKTLNEMRLNLKESREQLEKANEELSELGRLKSMFVSTASHELRTPLTAIKAYVEVIKDGDLGAVNEQQKEKLEIANRNIDRLIKQVNALLDLSRIEAKKLDLHMGILDPRELINEAKNLVEKMVHSWGHDLRVMVDRKLPSIWGDHNRIIQGFENLIGNAVKYTPENGVICIRAELHDKFGHFVVQDTGIGIPKEEISRIFDHFYHVDHPLVKKHGGAGLGLAIVKGIIETHGGEIWVETEPNKGSAFNFTLPVFGETQMEGTENV